MNKSPEYKAHQQEMMRRNPIMEKFPKLPHHPDDGLTEAQKHKRAYQTIIALVINQMVAFDHVGGQKLSIHLEPNPKKK